MELQRQNPDEILRVIHEEEQAAHRGHLKIFFGYAAGVGKTYAMLRAAHVAKHKGIDVVAGYVEPHARPQTLALLKGLEMLPVLETRQETLSLHEFDLDAALARKPQLILVDELAHTNAAGCRHAKRYQDVQELLRAGIDVYATVNVQHLESLNDKVASVTGVIVRERIPDSVFDSADHVELVDIEPQELLERMRSGKIYKGEQADRAAANFFTIDNLTALREIALRRCADRMNQSGSPYTEEHILVCLSSAPSNSKIIRTASRMANAFCGSFSALFVETPDFANADIKSKERLRANIRLAQQLGARIETVYGDDVAFQIAEFARLAGVSKVVIGRSATARRFLFNRPPLTERLIAHAPNLDIHIIPDNAATSLYRMKKSQSKKGELWSLMDFAKSGGMLFLATLIGFLFARLGFAEANIIMVYILGVLLISVITTHRVYSLISSVVSVLIFNFFFTIPRFTFQAYEQGYPITFLIMFIAAFLTGSLATRLKNHAKAAAQAAYRTKILFDTNQLLQQAPDKQGIVTTAANQITKLLDRSIVVYLTEDGVLSEPNIFAAADSIFDKQCLTDNERAVATWVLKNNKHAGATTDTLSNAKCLYLAIRVRDNVYGVVGIVIGEQAPDAFENSVLLSILGECALALENEKNAREKEAAAILAKNEQLRANLLRAISHDLRTPLTSISGNASNLLSNGKEFDDATRQQIYADIYDDSLWLVNLVENLLSVTRIEEGQMSLRLSAELMDEVIAEALAHTNRKRTTHTIKVYNTEELLLARIDARLIVQVFINIVDNALKYTPDGSEIAITVKKKEQQIMISIADNGPGIPDEIKPRIFDMFYTGSNKIADSRRSLGLGLSLCKSIIHAHGGEITVMDNRPQGTVFTFTLPAGEVRLHE